MAVCRVEKTKNYTVMSNYHLTDPRLSLKAIGLLSKILSLPEAWDYTVAGLAKICREGRDAVRAALAELEEAGYILRRQTRDEMGNFSHSEYIIYETPQDPQEEGGLRQPLEDKQIQLSRASGTYVFPAGFILVAAMNPCPCGYYPDMNKCRCTPGEVSHYLHKLSQPLLERIDLCADVPPVNFSQISEEKPGESSALIRKRVEKARKIQQKRYQNEKICFNGELSGKQIRKYCVLTENALQVAKNAFELMELSARSYHRILKVSRTIADMEGEELIHTRHVAEALTYKAFDKKYRS